MGLTYGGYMAFFGGGYMGVMWDIRYGKCSGRVLAASHGDYLGIVGTLHFKELVWCSEHSRHAAGKMFAVYG